jgi:hypothetical protein
VLAQLCKKLKNGGLIMIKVPTGEQIKNLLAENITEPWKVKSIYPLEHINCYQPDTFDTLLRENGLKKIHLTPKFNKNQIRQSAIDFSKFILKANKPGFFLFKKTIGS